MRPWVLRGSADVAGQRPLGGGGKIGVHGMAALSLGADHASLPSWGSSGDDGTAVEATVGIRGSPCIGLAHLGQTGPPFLLSA